ncbi:matrixin family metalloprotease [Actinomadura spongiicola]|uniref:matrixin family metalloprotease n=1 Tax=Actinomadura spongiicola TaxID=2303421 RepID=UPI0011C15713|nr:matrixin family metalloprotease [Actinomadura spongiicola]
MIRRVHGFISATIATLLTIGAFIALAPAANAYKLLGCSYAGGGNNLRWSNLTTRHEYSNPADWSIEDWNSTSTQFNFRKSDDRANLKVTDGNFGNTEFDGIALDPNQNDPTTNSCKDGHWTRTVVAWWNRYWTDDYSGEKKKSVMSHEVGHALGLAHAGDPARECRAIPLMIETTHTRWERCGISKPRGDDINGANSLY